MRIGLVLILAVGLIGGRRRQTTRRVDPLTPDREDLFPESSIVTPWVAATCTRFRVPTILFVTASQMFSSISATCLCAAASCWPAPLLIFS